MNRDLPINPIVVKIILGDQLIRVDQKANFMRSDGVEMIPPQTDMMRRARLERRNINILSSERRLNTIFFDALGSLVGLHN